MENDRLFAYVDVRGIALFKDGTTFVYAQDLQRVDKKDL